MDSFEVTIRMYFKGASLAELKDSNRFKTAPPGDHLGTVFQCANCQSQNIRGTDLVIGDAECEVFEAVCTRATLDAF